MTALFAVVIGLGLIVRPPEAPGSSVPVCQSMDSTGSGVLAWVRSVATQTDGASARQRAIMRLPLVPEHKVTYVTDEYICRSLLSEYNRYSGTRDSRTGVASPRSEQVCVVQVGTVYVVTDPSKTFGEFIIFVTMDRDFQMLAHALG